jgi:hypothetical protein
MSLKRDLYVKLLRPKSPSGLDPDSTKRYNSQRLDDPNLDRAGRAGCQAGSARSNSFR